MRAAALAYRAYVCSLSFQFPHVRNATAQPASPSHRVWHGRRCRRSSVYSKANHTIYLILVRKACLIGGAASLVLASLILARVPYRLSLSLYTMQPSLIDLFFLIEKVLNVASKPLWFSSGFCMAIALIIPCDLKSEADAQEAHASNVPATLWLTLPLVCLAGFLLERTWGTLSFPAYDDPFVAQPWWTYRLPPYLLRRARRGAGSNVRDHSLQKAESFTARNVVIAFAAGIICWNLWTRAVPYPAGDGLAISLGACTCTILLSVLTILICKLSHSPKTLEKQGDDPQQETTSQAIHEALERLDLAPREYEVARMLLQGKSSSQTAELLGLNRQPFARICDAPTQRQALPTQTNSPISLCRKRLWTMKATARQPRPRTTPTAPRASLCTPSNA